MKHWLSHSSLEKIWFTHDSTFILKSLFLLSWPLMTWKYISTIKNVWIYTAYMGPFGHCYWGFITCPMGGKEKVSSSGIWNCNFHLVSMLFTKIPFLIKSTLFIWPVALYVITEFYRKDIFLIFLRIYKWYSSPNSPGSAPIWVLCRVSITSPLEINIY